VIASPVRLLGVFAHPDDDAYLIGGQMLLHASAIEPTIVFATSGEAGPISDPTIASRETLGGVREGEQREYLALIGHPEASVHFLRYPDYYLPDVPLERLVDEIAAILDDVCPHLVITFGPDGLTSHHDHIRVGEATTEAFHRVRSEMASSSDAFQRLYYVALARSDVDRFYEGVNEGSHEYGEEGALFDITGVPDDTIAVRVDVGPVRDRKLAGMLVHRTQLIEHERIPESLRWIYMDAECFVQAFPDRPSGGEVRTDLLADLSLDAAPSNDVRAG
jgi:LmbE family N-acetylglucosaminyl deacetylase